MIDIKFNIDGLTTGDKRLDFGSENEISTLYRLLVDRLNDLNMQLPQNVKEKYPNIDFPTSVDVKILMVDNNAFFQECFDNAVAKKLLGFFNLTNMKNILGPTDVPDEFIIVVEADINNFNRIYEQYGKYLDVTKEEMLNRYLITLTHEISHAVEFIENSGGLTPFAVEELFEKDLFEHEVDTCATGYGVSKYQQDYEGVNKDDDAQINDIMEDRVELKGQILYHQLNISSAELSNVLGDQTINAKQKLKRTVLFL